MRYSDKEFPTYRFIPGQSQHPEKEGGYLRGQTIEAFEFGLDNYATNETYLYAIDLFNHEYYWEAHVYWEVLWNYVGRKTSQGYFLQALIKLAAAGVKSKLNQLEPSRGHVKRALEHLEQVQENELFGLNKKSLSDQIKNFGHTFKIQLS